MLIAPAARLDLLEIIDFIAADNPSAADAVRVRIFEALDMLEATPGAGHLRADLTGRPLRFWTVDGRYTLAYTDGQRPALVRVFGPGRDIAGILGRM